MPNQTQLNVSVVLVDRTRAIDPSDLLHAAQALDFQVKQHLSPTWLGVSATVSAASSAKALRPGDWPIYLVADLPPGEGGFHLDVHHRPYSKVIASPDDPTWTIDASHELCEMLVDPYGSRLQASSAITIDDRGEVVDADGTFEFLVEACDPCEASQFAYEIHGVAVSDFITPNYYDSQTRPGVRYSFQGNIVRPRQLLEGGYISFLNEAAGELQQILWVDTPRPVLKTLGKVSGGRSLREGIHREMGAEAELAKFRQRHKAGALPVHVQRRMESERRQRAESQDRIQKLESLHGV